MNKPIHTKLEPLIKIEKEKISFVKQISNIFEFKNNEYFFIPYYFRVTETEDVYELLELGKLPTEIVKVINEKRGVEIRIENEHLEFACYLTGHDKDTIIQMFKDFIKHK